MTVSSKQAGIYKICQFDNLKFCHFSNHLLNINTWISDKCSKMPIKLIRIYVFLQTKGSRKSPCQVRQKHSVSYSYRFKDWNLLIFIIFCLLWECGLNLIWGMLSSIQISSVIKPTASDNRIPESLIKATSQRISSFNRKHSFCSFFKLLSEMGWLFVVPSLFGK